VTPVRCPMRFAFRLERSLGQSEAPTAWRRTARPSAENRPSRHRGRLAFDPRRRFCVGHVSSAEGVSRETRRRLALELRDELGVVVAANGRLVLSPPEVWFSGLYGHVGRLVPGVEYC
jgi:hypothetical protein